MSDALDQFVALKDRKTTIERQLRQVKEQIAPLEAALLDQFAQEGVSGKRHASSGKMVSIARRIWARAADGDKVKAAAALQGVPELADYVEQSFNVNSLSAFFREAAQADPDKPLEDLLPASLQGAIELTEDHQLSVRG